MWTTATDDSQRVPVLGICYGAQLTGQTIWRAGGEKVIREYGRAILQRKKEDVLPRMYRHKSQVWMSHSEYDQKLPAGFELLADTESIPVAAFKNGAASKPLYGVQFHPEVYHSKERKESTPAISWINSVVVRGTGHRPTLWPIQSAALQKTNRRP